MPSFDHEILVDLFRDNGTLAAELLRTCAGIAVDHARVEPASIDLTQVVPAEYRADTVAVLHDRDGRPVTGVIVEVQRKADRDKRLTWPVSVAALRAQLDCPGGGGSRRPVAGSRRQVRSGVRPRGPRRRLESDPGGGSPRRK